MKKYYLIMAILIPVSSLAQSASPYISKVYDFNPAPGQFVNEMPEYEVGDTKDDMIRKVESSIIGDEKILISLGGYGGNVVFGFDHLIVNVPDAYDFKIWGNAFYSNANPNPNAPKEGGSCEPGIVMVSYDANANGIPDDEWYELAGSEYDKTETIKNYEITYYKPDDNKVALPDSDYPFISDKTYIKWNGNQGDEGYVYRNTFHSQSYYPLWLEDKTLNFLGTKLANNYVDESGNGSYFVQYAYAWGYADNHINNDARSSFKIEWAIDKNGNKVNLPGINFVKVYTAVNQYCGWLGETSTEVMGAEDLHVTASLDDVISSKATQNIKLLQNPVDNELRIINSGSVQEIRVFNVCGQQVISNTVNEGVNNIDVSSFPSGYYVLQTTDCKIKFIKR
ncbi:MAG: T9SS type A sorting domain-containing protein [Muribaculaceae bacterium]